ncbi:MAG TPA: hypothetical protein VK537_07080 [Galbitalea sp.]|nr:hypothetical protein [Galbitalea sp.]
MFEQETASVLVAKLRESKDELDFVRHRATGAAQVAPHRDASGWSGPAGWAYQRSLALLNRDLDTAVAMLRSASNLTSAAIYQLGQGD